MSAKIREWIAMTLLEWSGNLAHAAMRICPEMFPEPDGDDWDDPNEDVINPRTWDESTDLPF